MTNQEAEQLLIEAGFDGGWALLGGRLTIWEHAAEPPAPLTRPVSQETPTE